MRSASIGRLAFYYTLLAALALLLLGLYSWRELAHTREQLQARQTQAAREELAEAWRALMQGLYGVADRLAQWDETRQQLNFPEYYALWRQSRVRDAGLVPPTCLGVALYDRLGQALASASPHDPLPQRLPAGPSSTPLTLLAREGGRILLYHYRPVHADPGHSVGLGFLGLKLDLAQELARNRLFRYADLATLSLTASTPRQVDMALPESLTVALRENTELKTCAALLQASVLRLYVAMLALVVLAIWLLRRFLVRPLRRLAAHIDALHTSATSLPENQPPLPYQPIQELERLRRAFSDYQERLTELHLDLERNSLDLFRQAHHDALTGAFNRRAFEEDWHQGLADRRRESLALILFDCDHFKAINDTYGHNVGDAVIQAIAHCLQQALRADDRLYRLGGDEFATVIADTDLYQAHLVAERCLEQVHSHDFRQYGLAEPVTLSIGVAFAEAPGQEGEPIPLSELQRRADLAMYAAKRPGGQKIALYTPFLEQAGALVSNRSVHAVFQALQDPALIELAYQPVVRLPGAQVEYAEALTRIRLDERLIYPGDIFPIVQGRHLDAEFDLAVLRALNRDLDARRLPPGAGVSLNISAAGIVHTRVMDTLLALLEAERGRKIVVEITETALITQMETATANIQRLRAAGALVALDDFGSGYSSLRYLATMPVDLVKFDITLVRLLEDGQTKQRLLLADIARLVRDAGYQLVAEGIETPTQLEKVIDLGFTHAQGYLFGKPGPWRGD